MFAGPGMQPTATPCGDSTSAQPLRAGFRPPGGPQPSQYGVGSGQQGPAPQPPGRLAGPPMANGLSALPGAARPLTGSNGIPPVAGARSMASALLPCALPRTRMAAWQLPTTHAAQACWPKHVWLALASSCHPSWLRAHRGCTAAAAHGRSARHRTLTEPARRWSASRHGSVSLGFPRRVLYAWQTFPRRCCGTFPPAYMSRSERTLRRPACRRLAFCASSSDPDFCSASTGGPGIQPLFLAIASLVCRRSACPAQIPHDLSPADQQPAGPRR